MGFFLALAAAVLKVILTKAGEAALSSAGASFGSIVGTRLGEAIFPKVQESGQVNSLKTLEQNPTPSNARAVQDVLANQFSKDPPFTQKVDSLLKTESPADWKWAHSISPQNQKEIDWDKYFDTSWENFWSPIAAKLQQKYGLSDEQTTYERTRSCPIDKKTSFVKYYRVQEKLAYEVPTSSWFWGIDTDPYDDKLRKGDYAVCSDGHKWWVFAANA